MGKVIVVCAALFIINELENKEFNVIKRFYFAPLDFKSIDKHLEICLSFAFF